MTQRHLRRTVDIGHYGLKGLIVVLTMGTLLLITVLGSQAEPAAASFSGLPTETPRRDLPRALNGSVLDSAQVGDYIVVVGDFNSIQTSDSQTLATSGVYAYHIDTGELVHDFLPTMSRTSGADPAVNAVVATGSNSVVLGGTFNTVNGVTRHRVVKMTLSTGAVDTNFVADANSAVTNLATYESRVIIGGEFTTINAIARQRLATVNVNSGVVNFGFKFDITESGRTNSAFNYGPRSLDVTDNGILVVVHRARQVGGFDRPGIALIDLKSNNLTGYSTDYWDGIEIFAYEGAVSPDGDYVVVVSNGGDFPLLGKDVGVRFDIDDRHTPNQSERWVARNFDSTYSVAISDSAVYMGGHFCWVEGPLSQAPYPGVGEYTNDNSCFGATPASRYAPETVYRDQIAAFDPATGTALDWNPGTDADYGVTSIEVIDRGLLVGHDGTFMGANGTVPRSWNVGAHGFFDNANPGGLPLSSAFSCGNQPASHVGTDGDDVIRGTSGNDVIVALGGDDEIWGLGGTDIICGGYGDDTIYGGDGGDTIYGNQDADRIYGQGGADLVHGGWGQDTIFGGSGTDELRGNLGADRIYGGLHDDEIFGWTGDDVLHGGYGNDKVYGWLGDDTVEGFSGSDLVVGGPGTDSCSGAVLGVADSAGDSVLTCEAR